VAGRRQLYTAAILNTDPACCEVVLDEVATAMDIRLDELADMQGYAEERRQIALAARSLLLKRAEWGRVETSQVVANENRRVAAGQRHFESW
jgi:hypothetical protein